MTVHEHALLAEHRSRIQEGERRGGLEVALAELRQARPTLRQRFAGTLLALAHRLSPETVPTADPDKACLRA